jgi:phosphoribosylformylglycinamidine synthase PurS subunit
VPFIVLGYQNVSDIRIGKYFEIKVAAKDNDSVAAEIEEICDKLLANVNMETYRYELVTEMEDSKD